LAAQKDPRHRPLDRKHKKKFRSAIRSTGNGIIRPRDRMTVEPDRFAINRSEAFESSLTMVRGMAEVSAAKR
jgi:hypothetical protein